MDLFSTDFENLESDDKYEKFFRYVLSRNIPDAELDTFELRYIPDYIRELRNNKAYWGKEYRKFKDVISLNNWTSYAKQMQDEIRKHKMFLRNLDHLRRLFVRDSDVFHYFSKNIDPERVEALVSRLKENESDDDIIHNMLKDKDDPVNYPNKRDFTHTFYVIYASCARYGEFRIRPSRTGNQSDTEPEES